VGGGSGSLWGEPIGGHAIATLDLILSRAQIRPEHTQLDYERYNMLGQVRGVTVLDPVDVYLAAESKFLGLQRMASAGLPEAPTISDFDLTTGNGGCQRAGGHAAIARPGGAVGPVCTRAARDAHWPTVNGA
jgi:hypothetical protein